MESQYYNNSSVFKTTGNTNSTMKMVPSIKRNVTKIEKFKSENNTSKKSLWGRPLWFSLHYGALHYPDPPAHRDIKDMVALIKGLPLIIPCDECKNHANNFIEGFKDEQLSDFARSSKGVFYFFWMFHNHVNRETGKPTITLEKAYDIFKNNPSTAL